MPAMASHDARQGQPESRALTLVVYGNDPCPTGDDGTIIVCARKPESERYRIPKEVRAKPADTAPAAQAWGSKVQTLDAASAIQLPDSCSAVGTNGATGCSMAALHQWYAERQMDGQSQPAH
jgi:hypothetical protein